MHLNDKKVNTHKERKVFGFKSMSYMFANSSAFSLQKVDALRPMALDSETHYSRAMNCAPDRCASPVDDC